MDEAAEFLAILELLCRLPVIDRTLRLRPINLKDSNDYVRLHDRFHRTPIGHKFSLAAVNADGRIVGVAIVGRPLARELDKGYTLQVTRLCSDGTANVGSFLYRRAWHAAKALGYLKIVTYTFPHESGASLRAAGWRFCGEAGGGSWDTPTRRRIDPQPAIMVVKHRWECP